MKLTIGGHSTNALLDRLTASGIAMNDYAGEYIAALRHQATVVQRTIDVRFVTPSGLGLSGGGRLSQIYAAASRSGFGLCPPDTALYLRLSYMDQPPSADNVLSAGKRPEGSVTVASASIGGNTGMHRGLYLRNVDGQLWLRGYVCDDEYIWPGDSVFAFVSPDK